eukprot:TRINITY_DN8594_c0_g1_i1.p1 TRINITY_DN8594_c0_g1~~TRINITY_DN8594_c0_g1_i1.p1  ORF type:complete len:495 (+),score=102.68 TRINITY_DN8594_c0_g1_i1:109-1593(+)
MAGRRASSEDSLDHRSLRALERGCESSPSSSSSEDEGRGTRRGKFKAYVAAATVGTAAAALLYWCDAHGPKNGLTKVTNLARSTVSQWTTESERDEGMTYYNDASSTDMIWVPLSGWDQVAVDEGGSLHGFSGDLRKCEEACLETLGCNSFAHAEAESMCYLKDKKFKGDELTFQKTGFTTFVRRPRGSGYYPRDPSLLQSSKAPLFTFYMYRAQGNTTYPPMNVNAASLGGVLWYLHNEVTCHCPRRFQITRILRYKVQYRATQPLFDRGMSFGVRYAFDKGKCTGPWYCAGDGWDKYGYIMGCNDMVEDAFPFPTWKVHYPGAAWYSVPGQCPSREYNQHSEECVAGEPGGRCEGEPTGAGNCTYNFQDAGWVDLDDVTGIKDEGDPLHKAWCDQGCREYVFETDSGKCTNWWDGKKDPARNKQRMDQVDKAFKEKYPEMPSDEELPSPPCDFSRHGYFPRSHEAWVPIEQDKTPASTEPWTGCVEYYHKYG